MPWACFRGQKMQSSWAIELQFKATRSIYWQHHVARIRVCLAFVRSLARSVISSYSDENKVEIHLFDPQYKPLNVYECECVFVCKVNRKQRKIHTIFLWYSMKIDTSYSQHNHANTKFYTFATKYSMRKPNIQLTGVVVKAQQMFDFAHKKSLWTSQKWWAFAYKQQTSIT